MSCLRSKGTLGKRPRMRNVFLQLVCTKSNTYSSYGDTTTSYQPRESGWSVFRSERIQRTRSFADRNDRTDTLDSDSFRRRRHQEHSHFQRSRHGRQRRDVGDRIRSQDRLEQNVQKRNVSWYAAWYCFAQLSETSCNTGQSKERPHKHA